MNQPTSCAWCGGELPPRARSLCSPECRKDKQRQQARDNRRAARANGADKTIVKICAQCGQEFKADRHSVMLCSLDCRHARNAETGQLQRAAKAAGEASKRRAKPKPTTCPVGYTTCKECGANFLHDGRVLRSFCCIECRRIAEYRKADRPWRGKAPRIHERDGYVCWLCGTPTAKAWSRDNPLSPTIDHVKPRSKGGTDDDDNLRTAHWICNSIRTDQEELQQINLEEAISRTKWANSPLIAV